MIGQVERLQFLGEVGGPTEERLGIFGQVEERLVVNVTIEVIVNHHEQVIHVFRNIGIVIIVLGAREERRSGRAGIVHAVNVSVNVNVNVLVVFTG